MISHVNLNFEPTGKRASLSRIPQMFHAEPITTTNPTRPCHECTEQPLRTQGGDTSKTLLLDLSTVRINSLFYRSPHFEIRELCCGVGRAQTGGHQSSQESQQRGARVGGHRVPGGVVLQKKSPIRTRLRHTCAHKHVQATPRRGGRPTAIATKQLPMVEGWIETPRFRKNAPRWGHARDLAACQTFALWHLMGWGCRLFWPPHQSEALVS